MTATRAKIHLEGPVDLPASLEPFRRWGDDLLDRWDGTTLVRTIPVAGGSVAYCAAVTGTTDRPALDITIEDTHASFPLLHSALAAAIHGSFLSAAPDFADLLRRDPVIARLDTLYPGLRPVLQHDLLAALVRAISAQQVNLRWAAETRSRLARAFGQVHTVAGHTVYSLPPERLAAVDPAEIRALQFTTRKAEYIVAAADAVARGYLDIKHLASLPDDEVIARLVALRGIGLWTAEWILVRVLGRPRVVAGDLGVRKAVGHAYLNTPLPAEAAVRAATAHWGASAALAQVLLLQGLVAGTLA